MGKENVKGKLDVRTITLCSLFAALSAIGAKVVPVLHSNRLI